MSAETAAAPQETRASPPALSTPAEEFRRDELSELKLIAFDPAKAAGAADAAPEKVAGWDWRRLKSGRLAAAASLTVVMAIGAAAAAAHVHGLRVAQVEQAQARALAHRLDAVTTRLESLETNRSRDDLTSMRKVLAEIKSNTASSRDVTGAVAQLSSRVDRLEKDQGARMDKLGDRLDHDAAARLSEMSARLEKLETKVAAPATVVVKTPAPAKPEAAKAAPPVSYDTTGAIDRPRARLRNFYLADIRNGYAMIASPGGQFAVGPGDMVPGGGRVLRIERHGRDWVVVTTMGQIESSDE